MSTTTSSPARPLIHAQPADLSGEGSIYQISRALADHIGDNWAALHVTFPDEVTPSPGYDALGAWVRCFLPSRGKVRLLTKPRVLKQDRDKVVSILAPGDVKGMGDNAEYWALRALTVQMSWVAGYRYSTAAHGSIWPMMDRLSYGAHADRQAYTFAHLWCVAAGVQPRGGETLWSKALGGGRHPALR